MPVRILNNSEIKAEARELIRTARVSPIRFTLLYTAITIALSLISNMSDFWLGDMIFSSNRLPFLSLSFVGILVSLISQVLDAGYSCYCLGVHRREKMSYETLFDAFSFAGKVIGLVIVQYVFIALWSMLFIIPGIVAAYRYSFAMWNLCQDPSLGIMEALNLSKQQTNGYKWQEFLLGLSFIGWVLLIGLVSGGCSYSIASFTQSGFAGIALGSLLSAIVSGLVSLYFEPYWRLSMCGFYLRATAPFTTEPPHDEQNSWNPEF